VDILVEDVDEKPTRLRTDDLWEAFQFLPMATPMPDAPTRGASKPVRVSDSSETDSEGYFRDSRHVQRGAGRRRY
jgi:hypothetical protein